MSGETVEERRVKDLSAEELLEAAASRLAFEAGQLMCLSDEDWAEGGIENFGSLADAVRDGMGSVTESLRYATFAAGTREALAKPESSRTLMREVEAAVAEREEDESDG